MDGAHCGGDLEDEQKRRIIKLNKKDKGREEKRRFNHHDSGENTEWRNRGKMRLMLMHFWILRYMLHKKGDSYRTGRLTGINKR